MKNVKDKEIYTADDIQAFAEEHNLSFDEVEIFKNDDLEIISVDSFSCRVGKHIFCEWN